MKTNMRKSKINTDKNDRKTMSGVQNINQSVLQNLVDNSTQTSQLKRVQGIVNTSPQVMQLKMFQKLADIKSKPLPSSDDSAVHQRMKFAEEQTGAYGTLDTDNEDEVFEFLGLYKDEDLENDSIDPNVWVEIKKALAGGKYTENKAQIETILVQTKIATNEELGAEVAPEQVSPADMLRMEQINKMHDELFNIFKSGKNNESLQKMTEAAKADPKYYMIYRGEWYERALAILQHGTFGGLPKVAFGSLLNVDDDKFQQNAKLQKERGDDKPKEVVNEWTINYKIADQYGRKFVILAALVEKDNLKISHPVKETAGSDEQGVIADSRMAVVDIAIIDMNPKPDYSKKVKGGS